MFKDFKVVVEKQLAFMQDHELYRSGAEKDALWETYLNSFPEGTNPKYRERTEHDCSACRQFVKNSGMLAIIDGELVSAWDVQIDGFYQVVADAMSVLVKSAGIENIYRSTEPRIGLESNRELGADGQVRTWHHFCFKLPRRMVITDGSIGTVLGRTRTHRETLERSLTELTDDALTTVLELIHDNAIYRGAEHKSAVEAFVALKAEYLAAPNKNLFLWQRCLNLGALSNFRGTVIGTLVVDLANGVDLEAAVKMFESKVAPQNYKRTSAVITKGMIAAAEKKVGELGLVDSLPRRHAQLTDIKVTDVLFADRPARNVMEGNGVFDALRADVSDKVPDLDKLPSMTIDEFMAEVIPKASTVELLLENRQESNLMSLIAPVNPDAPGMLKWGNNFSWTYNGEVTDSIKEKVKAAGGSVTGFLRCSLAWWNYDDLDIHVIEPGGNKIYFSSPNSRVSGGRLDVDMNAGGGETREPVENITWPSKDRTLLGEYRLIVHNFSKRENTNVGFQAQIEFNGVIHTFEYANAVPSKKQVAVATFTLSQNGLKITKSIPSSQSSKEVWGLTSQKFHRVATIMNSPNHWGDNEIGNKHWFFMLEGCQNPEPVRGFYNEFLLQELNEHRKVFEALGAKMRAPVSDKQLSGVGFSSTRQNYAVCRVSGDYNRTVKINFG